MRRPSLQHALPLVLIVLLFDVTGVIRLTAQAELPRDSTATRAIDVPAGELGNLFQGFASANWSWARYPGCRFAISFLARQDNELDHLWVCWKVAGGYGEGNRGRWTFELQTNNPEGHLPSGQVIARVEGVTHPPEGYFKIDLPNVRLRSGQIYHLVMFNTDPEPRRNWSSPNTIMSVPDQPWRGEGVMSFDGTHWTPWGSERNRVAPRQGGRAAYLLVYADGVVEGMPYYSARRVPIFGNTFAGQEFTWTQTDTAIAEIGFTPFREGTPPASLEYVVEKIGDRVLATGTLATPAQVGVLPVWHRAALHPPVTLRQGVRYRVYLKAPDCPDAEHGYAVFVPYGTRAVPRWADLMWNGDGGFVTFSGTWRTPPIPADLTFSMIAVAGEP